MNKYDILISSDLDYEGMVVDVLYSDDLLAKMNCDQGIEKTQLLIFNKLNEEPICKINYHEFIKTLNKAFIKLKEANSID